MRGLKDKVAIVTGGGAGIGLAICKRLAEEGSVVGVFDIDSAAAEAAAGEIAGAGGTVHAVACDVADYDAVRKAVAGFEAKAGTIDILVNNAGWDRFMMFTKTEPTLWDRIIAINLKGPLNMLHVTLPGMIERGSGKVVNIASDAARVGIVGRSGLFGDQGRTGGTEQESRPRDGDQGGMPQLRLPGPDRDLAVELGRRDQRHGRQAARRFRQGDADAAGSARSTISPAPSPFSPATMPTSLPAR